VPEPTPVETARQIVLDGLRPLAGEDVPLDRARGRILAEAVTSHADVPPFASSAMDGFAIPSGASGELTITGESRAGHPYDGTVEPGTAVRISTGAVVPRGTGAVVQVEVTEEAEGVVTVPAREDGDNIRGAGEDIRAGTTLLSPGAVLGPAAVGVLASIGHISARCTVAPRVALLTTGDELTAPGAPLPPGGIYSSNGPALAALVQDAGGRVVLAEDVPDTAEGTRTALGRAMEAADVVCVSGGVSVGPHDHVKGAFADQGMQERFWRVALKPGKPTWFGSAGPKLGFGLPGNPVSALVTFLLFARPALLALQGADPAIARITGRLTAPVTPEAGRTNAVRCLLRAGAEGWELTPTGPQGSHQLTSMLAAGALALIEPGEEELPAGTRVRAELLP
jgi:molybdopterin molybdotransferase